MGISSLSELAHLNQLKSVLLLYIDPGAGTLIWQLMAGTVIGVGFYFRAAWRRLFTARKQKGAASEYEASSVK